MEIGRNEGAMCLTIGAGSIAPSFMSNKQTQ